MSVTKSWVFPDVVVERKGNVADNDEYNTRNCHLFTFGGVRW